MRRSKFSEVLINLLHIKENLRGYLLYQVTIPGEANF